MKSYDEATAFLNHLRHLLLAVGLGAVFGGSLLVYLIAGTFTRPLEKLVDGVRASGRRRLSLSGTRARLQAKSPN